MDYKAMVEGDPNFEKRFYVPPHISYMKKYDAHEQRRLLPPADEHQPTRTAPPQRLFMGGGLFFYREKETRPISPPADAS